MDIYIVLVVIIFPLALLFFSWQKNKLLKLSLETANRNIDTLQLSLDKLEKTNTVLKDEIINLKSRLV